MRKKRIISYQLNLDTLTIVSIGSEYCLKKSATSKIWDFDSVILETKYRFYNKAIIECSLGYFLDSFEDTTFEISFPYRINETLFKVVEKITPSRLSVNDPVNHLLYKCNYSTYSGEEISILAHNKNYDEKLLNILFYYLYIQTSKGVYLDGVSLKIIYYSLFHEEMNESLLQTLLDVSVLNIKNKISNNSQIIRELKLIRDIDTSIIT